MSQKNITVTIAGRPYPLKIEVSQEEQIRQIAKDLNDQVNDFQTTYSGKDKQDCLAMVLLTYAVEFNKTMQENPVSEISKKLGIIEKVMDSILPVQE